MIEASSAVIEEDLLRDGRPFMPRALSRGFASGSLMGDWRGRSSMLCVSADGTLGVLIPFTEETDGVKEEVVAAENSAVASVRLNSSTKAPTI